ncbi:hypothetical protein AB0G74_21710 [Streptomyces sp. NPDC020875]|uniref:hypothetical protein n=1 Tax=Streptomyces sp. NPDC020875 TaxID=3154898 RepID=UPI0034060590
MPVSPFMEEAIGRITAKLKAVAEVPSLVVCRVCRTSRGVLPVAGLPQPSSPDLELHACPAHADCVRAEAEQAIRAAEYILPVEAMPRG